MKLYQNEISSATSRVRIALALKGLAVELLPVTILGTDAESRQPEYRRINPLGLVPALLTDEGSLITQSLAIIEYLDERYSKPALLPDGLEERAFSRSIAFSIAAEIHALIPPRVAIKLSELPGFEASEFPAWRRHWIIEGMNAVEKSIAARSTSTFVVGANPSIGDIFLFPQATVTERNGLDISNWPRIAKIVSNLRAIPAFADNAPASIK